MSNYGLRLLKQLKFGTFKTDKPINYSNRNTARQQRARVSNFFFKTLFLWHQEMNILKTGKYCHQIYFHCAIVYILLFLQSSAVVFYCLKTMGFEVVLLLFEKFKTLFSKLLFFRLYFAKLNLRNIFQVNQFLLDLATLSAENRENFGCI